MKYFNYKFGRKRRFLIYGFLNFLATVLSLQLLLLFIKTGFATLLSQTLNFSLGLFLYGKLVFKVDKLKLIIAFKYFLLSIILWVANWFGINYLSLRIGSDNIAALVMIPFIVSLSYFCQKTFVFRNL